MDGYDKLKPFGFPIHGCHRYALYAVRFVLANLILTDTHKEFYGCKLVLLIMIHLLLPDFIWIVYRKLEVCAKVDLTMSIGHNVNIA